MSPARDGAILVTGGTGFIGRHVLAELGADARRPRSVLVLRRPEDWDQLDFAREVGPVRLVQGGLDDVPRWQPEVGPLGGILHLAAPVAHSRRAPEDMRPAIVDGTLAVVRLAAAAGCRLVVASTSGTVGCTRERGPRADENAPFARDTAGTWPYYAAKIEMEERSRELARELGVELVFVRPPILLGPGDHRLRSTSTVYKVLRGKFPFVIRGGMHFADVRDAARALVAALDHPAPQPVYHLDGTECGVEEFFVMLEEVSGAKRPPLVLPYPVAKVVSTLLERFHVVPDPVVVEMARHWWGLRSLHSADDLGWKPRDPRETLRDTADWLRRFAGA